MIIIKIKYMKKIKLWLTNLLCFHEWGDISFSGDKKKPIFTMCEKCGKGKKKSLPNQTKYFSDLANGVQEALEFDEYCRKESFKSENNS